MKATALKLISELLADITIAFAALAVINFCWGNCPDALSLSAKHIAGIGLLRFLFNITQPGTGDRSIVIAYPSDHNRNHVRFFND